MVKKKPRAIAKTQKPPNSDGDGNQVRNEILLGLPAEERNLIFPALEFLRLNHLQMLHEVGDTIKSGYFCNEGMISTLSVFPDGKSVEVGLIGKEGFVGLPLIVGLRSSSLRANVQIGGSAFRISAEALSNFLRRCPELTLRLHQFSQIMAMQVAQIAACNRLHEVEERLARWLLMCADRAGNQRLPLTQDLLGQMLGTRRASVTIAAGSLQNAGFIEYRRGEVEILNRERLEETSCECYQIINQQIEKWRRESPPRLPYGNGHCCAPYRADTPYVGSLGWFLSNIARNGLGTSIPGISKRAFKMRTSAKMTLERGSFLESRVRERFGILPNSFRLGPETPEVIREINELLAAKQARLKTAAKRGEQQ